MTSAVDRLERQGFVRRRPHPTDRRTTLAEITEQGRTVAAQATEALNAQVFARPGLPGEQVRTLFALLRELRRSARGLLGAEAVEAGSDWTPIVGRPTFEPSDPRSAMTPEEIEAGRARWQERYERRASGTPTSRRCPATEVEPRLRPGRQRRRPTSSASAGRASSRSPAGSTPTGYRGRPWTIRQFAGFGNAHQTNERYKQILGAGGHGLSVAFDMPTLMGRDSDDPQSLGEVGHCGVAIDSAADMDVLFDGIPLGTSRRR